MFLYKYWTLSLIRIFGRHIPIPCYSHSLNTFQFSNYLNYTVHLEHLWWHEVTWIEFGQFWAFSVLSCKWGKDEYLHELVRMTYTILNGFVPLISVRFVVVRYCMMCGKSAPSGIIILVPIYLIFFYLIPLLLQSVQRHLVTFVSIVLTTCRRNFQWCSPVKSQSQGLMLSLGYVVEYLVNR
jgi:hypothetical protein